MSKRQIKTRIAIIVEGKTEQTYLNQMASAESFDFKFHPQLARKKRLSEILDQATELVNLGYDKVFVLLDGDALITQTTEKELKKLNTFLTKKKNSIEIVLNTPCLEFWFLLHYEDTGKYYRTCSKVVDKLQKQLNGYNKTNKFYKNNIYNMLRPFLSDACNRAEQLDKTHGKVSMDNLEQPRAQTYKIIKVASNLLKNNNITC